MAFDYQSLMPTYFDSGWSEVQVKNYFENKIQPEQPPVLPEPTPAEIKTAAKLVANAFYTDGIETHGGVIALSNKIGFPVSFIETCVAELSAGYAAWAEEQPEE